VAKKMPVVLTERQATFLWTILHNIRDTTDDHTVDRDCANIMKKITAAQARYPASPQKDIS
jgi:hypothetical protein